MSTTSTIPDPDDTIGTTFTLTLKSLPSDVPVAIRLRAVLKSLLRSYDFRAVSVLPIDPQTERMPDEHNLD